MNRVFTIILLLGFLFPAANGAKAQKKERKYHSEVYREVRKIREGTILVRLHTQQNAIDALRKLKKYDAVKYVREEQHAVNLDIYEAFTSQFTFCKVLFFLSSSSNELKNHNYEGRFLDENLEIDPSITVDTNSPIYIVDIGNVYFEAFGSHMEGLVVMNSDFEQLKSPFPYYVRKRSGFILIKRSNSDLVAVFQKNLLHYYIDSEDI